jgi:hypothetical protein
MDRISPSEGGDASSILAEGTMIKFLLHLFFISFLLNFVWEITQMPLYAEMGLGIRSDYLEFLRIHWEVTAKDALMVVTVFLLIAVVLRNWNWIKTWNKGWIMLWVALPLWQGIIEYYSVHMYDRWAYAGSMPLLFGVGISPLLQMLILPSIAILLSRHLLSDVEN